MKLKIVLKALSILLLIVSFFIFISFIVAIGFDEDSLAVSFLVPIGISLLFFSIMQIACRDDKSNSMSTKGGFLFVTLSWISASLIGSLPFYISGAIPHFTDAVFETMSGFTTTGASILKDIESLPKALLFWRSLTHWLGGMGIVVLTVAILPLLRVEGFQLVKAEAPGPSLDRVTPRITNTAKALWGIYLFLTILQTVLLWAGGMTLFDSLTHTFGTLATGGFSPKNLSVGFYHSAYVEIVTTVFMLLAGINFTLYFRLITGRFTTVYRDPELRAYLGFFLVATIVVAWNLFGRAYDSFGTAVRYAAFQVASILTTTGFSSADFEAWPVLSKVILFLLMFVGGCSGSTGGGIKVIRILTLFKQGWNEMRYLIHPRAVFAIRIGGKSVKKDMVYHISGFVFLYVAFVLLTTLVVATGGFDIETSITAALATVGNIGPGFGLIGPMDNYSFLPAYIKWFLSFAMMTGRLELYTVLVLFTSTFWRR